MDCIFEARTCRYLPKNLGSASKNLETDFFHYDHANNSLNCKLLTTNPYRSYFEQVYPSSINEYQLTDDMLDVLKSYTDSQTNEMLYEN